MNCYDGRDIAIGIVKADYSQPDDEYWKELNFPPLRSFDAQITGEQ